MIYSSHIRNSFFIYLRSYKRSNVTLHIKYITNEDVKQFFFVFFFLFKKKKNIRVIMIRT
jgi:hypothetical protein